jgi:nitrite reductase (NO-forming)
MRPRARGPRPSDLLAAFFLFGLIFLAAAAVVAIIHAATGWADGHWLALHLAFVGGVSQLVLGAGQFFAAAFLATTPPGPRLVRYELISWNAGAILVAVGVPPGVDALTIAGAASLASGLCAFIAALRGLGRRSLQSAPWALRWYEACAVFLGIGVLAGVLLAAGVTWSTGSLLGAHMALNLAGWFGTAIVGTLHTFFPSLTQTRLAFARLQLPTFAAWTSGTAALAAGYALAVGPLVIAGWAVLGLAAGLLCVNLGASLRAAPVALALPARLVAAAQACLLVALVVALVGAITGDATGAPTGGTRAALAILLLPGWLGLTVSGSLLHLLAMLARVRDFTRPLPPARPARDSLLAGIATVAVLALAAGRSGDVAALETAALVALLIVYALLSALVARRAVQALRGGVPGLL